MNNVKNIKTGVNDNLRYSKDDGVSWTDINLPEGLYEFNQINNEIHRQLELNDDTKNYPIELEIDIASLKSIIELAPQYQVDLTASNSITHVLGFNPQILTNRNNKSENKIDLFHDAEENPYGLTPEEIKNLIEINNDLMRRLRNQYET